MSAQTGHSSGLIPEMALASWAAYLSHLGSAASSAGAHSAAGPATMGTGAPPHAHAEAQPAPVRRRAFERITPFAVAPTLVVLPPGQVMRGAHPQDPDAMRHEMPCRLVTLAHPLAVSLSPVTFDQWDACVAAGGTRHKPGDANWGRGNRPVINVSWHDAEEFLGWLSRQTGERFRLLTEAEWEFACWAGQPQHERLLWGADLGFRQLRHHAWYRDNAEGRTHPVGELQANAWGLSDMLGNVSEWVADGYHPDHSAPPSDGQPQAAPTRTGQRVFKGGSWLDAPAAVRPSARDRYPPDHRSYRVGFRVAMELPAGAWLDSPAA